MKAKKIILSGFILFSMVIANVTCALPAHYSCPSESTIEELINSYRNQYQLEALKNNSFLSQVAKQHSQNMANRVTSFGHTGFTARMKLIFREMSGSKSVAENVAYGKLSADNFVTLWLNSQGHRKNILGNYQLTGIGMAQDANGYCYVTQVFVRA